MSLMRERCFRRWDKMRWVLVCCKEGEIMISVDLGFYFCGKGVVIEGKGWREGGVFLVWSGLV
jgi:hypothetical protein